jgi:vanillate O-demethylase ferredoxin subunit
MATRRLQSPPGTCVLLRTFADAEGICGACEIRALSGIPDHRYSVLTPDRRAEGKRMMICCSGAKTEKLVLDL